MVIRTWAKIARVSGGDAVAVMVAVMAAAISSGDCDERVIDGALVGPDWNGER